MIIFFRRIIQNVTYNQMLLDVSIARQSIYRAFLAGTAHQGYEREKDKRMTVSLCQDERLKTRSMMKGR